MVSDMVSVLGDRMTIRFDRFDESAYQIFLKAKRIPEYTIEFHEDTETYSIHTHKRFANFVGVEVPESATSDLPFAYHLFDDQLAIVQMALAAKRFAVWSDCGMGKTAVYLEFARHVLHRTGGKVLAVTVNDVVDQTIDECGKFYGDAMPMLRLKSRQQMKEWMADPHVSRETSE